MQSVDVWVVDKRLGQGGIGTVYKCHNRHAPRIQAAVKLLSPTLAASSEIRRRFVREAELLFQLDHPNIVKVRNIRMDHEPPFIEMAFVEGRSLASVLGDGKLDVAQVCALGAPLLRAVGYLHERGVSHRDIKPDNVIVQGLAPTLVDFGLAAEDHSATISKPGAMMGTVGYVPPEWGSRTSPRGEDWDRYSLGVILWECLQGVPAFPLDASRALMEQLIDVRDRKLAVPDLDPGAAVPDELREVVRRLTARDPHDRACDLLTAAGNLDALRARLEEAGQRPAMVAAVPPGFDGKPVHRPTFADVFGEDAVLPQRGAPAGSHPTMVPSEDWAPEPDVRPAPEATALDAAGAPTSPEPAAPPQGGGRSPLVLLGVGLAAAALLGVGAWMAIPTAPDGPGGRLTPRLQINLQPADPGLPVALQLDGEPLALGEAPPVGPGSHRLVARVGVDCGSGALPPHCAEVVETYLAEEGLKTHPALRVTLPEAPTRVVPVTASGAAPARLAVDGAAWIDPPDPLALSLLPGPHRVVAQAGTCPDEPCGADCPATCSEAQVDVVVPFADPVVPATLTLSAPAAPAPAPAPAPSGRASTGPVTVAAFQSWLVRNPAYQPGGAQAAQLADGRYLRGWDGAEPRNPHTQEALPGGAPVTRVSAGVAQAYCASRGGLASTEMPVVGLGGVVDQELRAADGGGVVALRSGGGSAPVNDPRGTYANTTFRCARR